MRSDTVSKMRIIKMVSSTVLFILLFFLLLVCFLYMDEEALGSQFQIRKLKETISIRRKLEGNGLGSSKMWGGPSISRHCGHGANSYNKMATTYHPNHGSLPAGNISSSLCPRYGYYGYRSRQRVRCWIVQTCYTSQWGRRCTNTERCQTIPGRH